MATTIEEEVFVPFPVYQRRIGSRESGQIQISWGGVSSPPATSFSFSLGGDRLVVSERQTSSKPLPITLVDITLGHTREDRLVPVLGHNSYHLLGSARAQEGEL